MAPFGSKGWQRPSGVTKWYLGRGRSSWYWARSFRVAATRSPRIHVFTTVSTSSFCTYRLHTLPPLGKAHNEPAARLPHRCRAQPLGIIPHVNDRADLCEMHSVRGRRHGYPVEVGAGRFVQVIKVVQHFDKRIEHGLARDLTFEDDIGDQTKSPGRRSPWAIIAYLISICQLGSWMLADGNLTSLPRGDTIRGKCSISDSALIFTRGPCNWDNFGIFPPCRQI